MVIENNFGIVKKRFRQLKSVELRDVDRITKLILSCCVLHNICVDSNDADDDLVDSDDDNDDGGDESMVDSNDQDEEAGPSDRILYERGRMKRNAMCAQLI